ncbi:MAG: hypothetical protein JNM81_15965 [Rhodospirillaceae bacterium]|nr:hypothetical protein [Rhodospirillaceae bacterium]
MSVSSKQPVWLKALLSGAAAAALAVAAAHAQPQSQPPQQRGPVALVPQTLAPQTVVQPAEEPAAAPASLSPTIAVDTLERIETDRIGLVDESAGALSADMWVGSDPAFVRAILAQLPHQMPSLAMRRLAQNLLLPPARQPEIKSSVPVLDAGAPVESDATADKGHSTWLLEARLRALAGLGDWPSVVALIDVVPADRINEAIVQLRVDGLLVDGHTDAACTEVQAALSRQPDTYWQKFHVYCQWVNKQTSAAQLGLSLLREQGEDDPIFFWAADVMQGLKGPAPAKLDGVRPLELAMLRAGGQPFPDTLVQSGDATVMRVLATMPPAQAEDAKAPDAKDAKAVKAAAEDKKKRARQQTEARIAVAEHAVALGVADPQMLRDLYAGLDLSGGPAVPLAEANVDKLATRAYLYQTAKAQTAATARAEVIARIVDLTRADKGQKGPDLVTVGRVYAPMIAEFAPSPDLIWFAGAAARALLAAGEHEKAQAWIDLALQMARGSSDAANVADGLWAIARMAASNEGSGAITAQNFRAWQASLPSAQAAALRETLLNLLTALGDQVPPDEWLSVVGNAGPSNVAPPPSYVWNGLSLAARDDRVGDAAALSLVALGTAGPHQTSPVTLAKVIETLKAVGRDADARALAVEAALVQGL